jgi:hypothetical protein
VVIGPQADPDAALAQRAASPSDGVRVPDDAERRPVEVMS